MSNTPRTDTHIKRMETEDFDVELALTKSFARTLERELAHQAARADEAVRRLHLYRDREEYQEINRLHGIIAGQTAELERLRGGAQS